MREDSGHMDFILNGEAEIAVPAVDEIRTNEMEISGKVKVRTALELGGNLLIPAPSGIYRFFDWMVSG